MTVPDQTRPSGLSDSQDLAIDVITGGTHREAAGVARTTVTEWVNHRSDFCRELERRRYRRAQQAKDRVGALTTRAPAAAYVPFPASQCLELHFAPAS